MKTSVVIPVFNQQEYLSDAIESALAQTVPCEIIVVNDGSTDNSLEVAKKYGVKIIDQINKGLSSARNAGIMSATTDYILPLDADDILLERCVEVMEEAIKSNDADVIAPSFKTFGVKNGVTQLTAIPSIQDFKEGNRIPYFSGIKRKVLQEVGGYNPRFSIGYEDWALWLDIFRRGHSLCTLDEVLVLYRTKETSMLTEAQKHHEEIMEQMRKTYPDLWLT